MIRWMMSEGEAIILPLTIARGTTIQFGDFGAPNMAELEYTAAGVLNFYQLNGGSRVGPFWGVCSPGVQDAVSFSNDGSCTINSSVTDACLSFVGWDTGQGLQVQIGNTTYP